MHQKYPHLEFHYELTLRITKEGSPISLEEFEDIEEEVMEKVTADYTHKVFNIDTVDIYAKKSSYYVSYWIKLKEETHLKEK